MNIYLYLLIYFLLTCCSTVKRNTDLDLTLPSDLSFSLPSREENASDPVFFQSLQLNPELFKLVGIALKENPGWQAKLAKIEQARAKVGYFIDESKAKLNGSVAWMPGNENNRESEFKTTRTPEWHSRANFGWELDLWGKWVAHKKEAEHLIDAEVNTRNGAQLTLIYEIANLWYQYAYLEEDIELIKSIIRNHHESHVLHLHNYHAGLDDNASLIKMESEIKSLVLEFNEKDRMQSICRTQLQTLVGDPLEFNISSSIQFSKEANPSPPNRMPSRALEGRPDILASKARFMAQSERTKSSALNLYPSINLNLSTVGMSGDLSKPFEQWKISGGPILDIPIWSPRRKTRLDVDNKGLKVMELEWKDTILQAIMEIETSMIMYNSLSEDLKILQNLVHENSKLVQLNENKFNAGLLSKMKLLEKVNDFEQSKRKANAAKLVCFLSFLNLSMNLGINWDSKMAKQL